MSRYLWLTVLAVGLGVLLPGLRAADDAAVLNELDTLLNSEPKPLPWTPRAKMPAEQPFVYGPWFQRRYELTEVVMPIHVRTEGKLRRVELPIKLDDDRDFFTKVTRDLYGWDRAVFRLTLPDELPPTTQFYFFVKNWDDLWLHVQLSLPEKDPDGTYHFTIPLSGDAACKAWTPRGHHRPWHQLLPGTLAELGVKLGMPRGETSDFSGKGYVEDITLYRDHDGPPEPPRVYDLIREPTDARVGKMVEVSFRVTHEYHDPFNRAENDVLAVVDTPSGERVAIHGFYEEGFLYDGKKRHDQLLVPNGAPKFAVRFTPKEPGAYTMHIGGLLAGERVKLPDVTFDVAPADADWHGYVQRMPGNKRLLQYSVDKSEFWGLGMNVRSPYDTRYVASFPFTGWEYTDFDIYEKLMRKYAQNGIKVMEVWMSPWWLALEWIPDAPGNHGVGHMNQYRAWKLDRLFQLADELDLYLILVINNHGKFSAWIDSDWGRSPFNKANGGFLETPMEYFSDAQAKLAFMKLADYMTARWGYSPHLLAWKLFTEIDLTGNNREWYKDPAVKNWHRFAGAYLKQVDPNHHLVTTHWATSYELVNEDMAKIPELDLLTLDIYYSGSGAKHFFDYLYATDRFVDSMEKPAIITEFGGSPHGDELPHILHQLHMALWGGYFTNFPVSPCFWWFPLVEEQNLYGEYANVARFTDGETRVGMTATHRRLSEDLFVSELRSPTRRLVWLLDTGYYFGGSLTVAPKRYDDYRLGLPALPEGDWFFEVWDCKTGNRIAPAAQVPPAATGEQRSIVLPPFTRDVAIKLWQTPAPAPVEEPIEQVPTGQDEPDEAN